MTPSNSGEVFQLIHSLFKQPSLLDRVRGLDHRISTLTQIADSCEIRVVPDLLPLLAADESLTRHVIETIVKLVGEITPTRLFWLDDQVRHVSNAYWSQKAWPGLGPTAISRLAQAAHGDPTVIGLLASHSNGYVRSAALELLAQITTGQEIPFLSLRANDWVDPVATRANELLISRLRPDNREAVLKALPFIVRVLNQDRRDHSDIERALTYVLLSDGGQDALARGTQFDTSVRRRMYELLTASRKTSERRPFLAALDDPDAIIRARAIRSIAADANFEERAEIVERLLRADPVPAVRRTALAALSEHMPQRIARVFPDILLDSAARVRGLAGFVANTHQLALVPREFYIQALGPTNPRRLSAAVEGVGETGTRADADLIASFLSANTARVRRSALRALAKLDAERAISAALAALVDTASSVRSAAVEILATHARRVDFEIVCRRVRSLSDPHARKNLLRVFADAPKWDAPVFLLEALADSDDNVRTAACRLLDRWIQTFNRNLTQPTPKQLQRIGVLLDSVSSRLPEETEKMLRFSIEPR